MLSFKNAVISIFVVLPIGILIGFLLVFFPPASPEERTKFSLLENAKIYKETEDTASTSGTPNFRQAIDFTQTVKKIRPAIVSITTVKKIKDIENAFHHFFEDFDHKLPKNHPPTGGKISELGSGIIISADGYILTNDHVIENVEELNVTLLNGEEYDAKIIGSDPSTEVALIKIDAVKLPVALLGNSDRLKIGQWVLAVGNPLGLTSTVSAGIISALNRRIDIIRDNANSGVENFIQTDAAINRGNSGGALVNINGEVIGVNTAIASETGFYVGYGFAIPINLVKRVVDDLKRTGRFQRGYLGIHIENVIPAMAKYFKLETPQGVHVSRVLPGTGAYTANLKVGDIILEVDGEAVNKTNELQAKISLYKTGDTVKLKVWRNQKNHIVEVVLGGLENKISSAVIPLKNDKEKSIPNFGLHIKNLTVDQMGFYGVRAGVYVSKVDRFSGGQKAGILAGDIILSVNRKSISDSAHFTMSLQKNDSNAVIQLEVQNIRDRSKRKRMVYLEINE
jgi:serine protease Do